MDQAVALEPAGEGGELVSGEAEPYRPEVVDFGSVRSQEAGRGRVVGWVQMPVSDFKRKARALVEMLEEKATPDAFVVDVYFTWVDDDLKLAVTWYGVKDDG